MAPGLRVQTSLVAGVLEEGLAVPVMFDGNLGQQQATARPERDHQAMTADFDFFRLNRSQPGEDAQRDLQFQGLGLGDRTEAGVLEGGGPGGISNRGVQGRDRQGVADAAAKVPTEVEGSKDAARLGKVRGK